MLRKRMNYLIHIKKSKCEFWNRFSKIFENLTVNFAFPIEYCNITQNQLSAYLIRYWVQFNRNIGCDTDFLFIFNLFSFIVQKSEKKCNASKGFFLTFFLSSNRANLLNHFLWHFFKFQNFTLQEKNIAKNSKEKTTKTTNAKVINAKTHATSNKSI